MTRDGRTRKVHREEVDVVVRFRKNGEIEPLKVCWKDGHSFEIDEVLAVVPFGPVLGGRRTMSFDVRLGGHRTRLYLEHRPENPEVQSPDSFVWWVYAFDRTLERPKGRRRLR